MNCEFGNFIRFFVAVAICSGLTTAFALDCAPAQAQAWDAPAGESPGGSGNVGITEDMHRNELWDVPAGTVQWTPDRPKNETSAWRHFASVYSFIVTVLLGGVRIYATKERLFALARLGNCVREHRRSLRKTTSRFAVAAVVVPVGIYLLESLCVK